MIDIYAIFDKDNKKFIKTSYTQNSPFYKKEDGARKAFAYRHKRKSIPSNEVLVKVTIDESMIEEIQ